MPGPLFAESSAAFKASLAAQLGCDPVAFESHALSVVERPEGSCERQLAVVATCGTGSVLSVRDSRLGDWAREQPLAAHFRIFLPSFLEGLAEHARALGYEAARSHSPSEGMVLSEDLPPRELPPGYRIAELPLVEQQCLRPGREFENALAEPEEDARIASIRIVFAAYAPDGAIAGVAGVWDQYAGIDEIGLDVARAHRGLGLATTLTIHATRWIRAGGRWPIYTYGVTNVRSMNNGLSAGYRPLWVLSVV